MIDRFDFGHLCRLAHLRFEPEEMEKLRPQLEQIVAWVSQLGELTIDGKAGITGEARLPFRPDEVEASLPRDKVLAAAVEKDEAFFKVPKVIEER